MSTTPQRVGSNENIVVYDSLPLFETLMTVLSEDDWFPILDDRFLSFFIVVGILLGLFIQTFLVAETTNYLAGLKERRTKIFWMRRYESLVGLGHFYSYLVPKSSEMILAIVMRKRLASASSKERFNLSRLSELPDEEKFGLSTEEIEFFKWCLGQEKDSLPDANGIVDSPTVVLNRSNRVAIFLRRASLNDIFLPGRIFERVVFGFDMRYHGPSLLFARPLTCFLFFPGCVIIAVILIASGIASMGIMWPRSVRRYLFDGPISKHHEQWSRKSPDAIGDLRSWLDEKMNTHLETIKDEIIVEFRKSIK